MSDYQPFGYTGEPGTCLWCGRVLQHKMIMCDEGDPGAEWYGSTGGWWQRRADKGGSYQDDSFCGLRCGYQFGRRLAELGRRLEAAGNGDGS